MKQYLWKISFRIRDVLIAGLGLILLSPVFLIIAIILKQDSPGPVFYGGPRAGRNGKPFKIWKFRTMHERPDSYEGPKITGENDSRITKTGAWLRQLKLNELPQLWNVLIGEMSLVGPRPEDPDIVETWPEEVQEEILSLRPGITSPASVLYRDEETLLAIGSLMETYFGVIQPSKIRLDQLYIRHRSFWVDLDILLWTALVLIPGLSKYKPQERLLYGGVLQRGFSYLNSWFVTVFIVALFAISISGILWRLVGPLDIGVGTSMYEALLFAVVFSIIGSLVGIQKVHWSKAAPTEIYRLIWTYILATLALILINEFTDIVSTRLILSATTITFLGLVITRYRSRLITGTASQWLKLRQTEGLYQERLLIIGSGDAGSYAAWMLANSKDGAKFNVVGYLDDDFSKQGVRIRGIQVLGGTEEIEKVVEKFDVGIILFAIHNINQGTSDKILARCEATNAQVIQFPDVIGHLSKSIGQNGRSKLSLFDEPPDQDCAKMIEIIDQLKVKIENAEFETCAEDIAQLQQLINDHNNDHN